MTQIYIARAQYSNIESDAPTEIFRFVFEADEAETVDLKYAQSRVSIYMADFIREHGGRIDVLKVRRPKRFFVIPH